MEYIEVLLVVEVVLIFSSWVKSRRATLSRDLEVLYIRYIFLILSLSDSLVPNSYLRQISSVRSLFSEEYNTIMRLNVFQRWSFQLMPSSLFGKNYIYMI